MKRKRTKVRRTIPVAAVNYRGKVRPCVVELDTTTGIIRIRPHGCQKTKSYSVADLFAWGQQLQLPLSQPSLL